jgi:hypothetical protein
MHALVEMLYGYLHFLNGVVAMNLGNFARMNWTKLVWLHFEGCVRVVELALSYFKRSLGSN